MLDVFFYMLDVFFYMHFIMYATPNAKKRTFKVLSATTTLCLAIMLMLYFFLDGSIRSVVVGWICAALSWKVVKTKSVEFMPFPLSCLLTLCAMMWFAYGVYTKDLCVMVPNVLWFILGVIQIALYKYYK
ncbi:putative SWEET sugar transporter [Helianthus annuus]|uniref:SWEET sugar transporter n=1 Tax=Helianthus annuus TaxID=4232 RepID=A0A9K3E1Z8_HELAN|nr:putative SWEET sugar transporter [Helianthus annuus]KAJ0451431.1 putative SWEET sugar transporter [Helianthus annuus]KAJ0473306.1 putative SWEET sugar transporter [Helianthus annuus]KAJ0648889.1 putative SWEET sugar transporter [Helianthus annuus]KAJ0652696.1 putative SWEET sugar transporter [Helianthus annuus]